MLKQLLLISHIVLEAPQALWVQDLPHHPTPVQRDFPWFWLNEWLHCNQLKPRLKLPCSLPIFKLLLNIVTFTLNISQFSLLFYLHPHPSCHHLFCMIHFSLPLIHHPNPPQPTHSQRSFRIYVCHPIAENSTDYL